MSSNNGFSTGFWGALGAFAAAIVALGCIVVGFFIFLAAYGMGGLTGATLAAVICGSLAIFGLTFFSHLRNNQHPRPEARRQE
jgi:hypothetical protein